MKAGLAMRLPNPKRDLEAVREINRDLVELKDALELKMKRCAGHLEERNRIIDQLEQRLKEVTPEPESAEVTKKQEPIQLSAINRKQTEELVRVLRWAVNRRL